jgi:hypothetical protein
MKAIHFTRSIGAGVVGYPICSAGYGRPSTRGRRILYTAILDRVTCKTCLRMLETEKNRFEAAVKEFS